MRSFRDTKLLPQGGIYLPSGRSEGEWQGLLWARAERQDESGAASPAPKRQCPLPASSTAPATGGQGTQTVRHGEGQVGPRPGQGPPSSSCMRSLGWDRLKVSTWGRPAHACPPVSTHQHRVPPPTAVPRVAGLMGLDGSPEVGVQGPRVLLSGHQGGHRAPRMGRSSAPRAPSPHAEPWDQQTPAQSGPAQRAQGRPTPTGRVLDDGPDLLLRPWASGPLTAPASPGQCTAARPSGRPSAGHEDCGSVNPGRQRGSDHVSSGPGMQECRLGLGLGNTGLHPSAPCRQRLSTNSVTRAAEEEKEPPKERKSQERGREAEGRAAAASPRAPGGQSGCPGTQASYLTQMSCFSPIGKFEYKSTISGVLYMGVVFLVI